MRLHIKSLLLSVTAIALGLGAAAQIRISGQVSDKKAKPIQGANIQLEGSYDGATTDAQGRYSFSTTEKGPLTMTVNVLGYDCDTLRLDMLRRDTTISVKLRELYNELNAVTTGHQSLVNFIQDNTTELLRYIHPEALDAVVADGYTIQVKGLETTDRIYLAFSNPNEAIELVYSFTLK